MLTAERSGCGFYLWNWRLSCLYLAAANYSHLGTLDFLAISLRLPSFNSNNIARNASSLLHKFIFLCFSQLKKLFFAYLFMKLPRFLRVRFCMPQVCISLTQIQMRHWNYLAVKVTVKKLSPTLYAGFVQNYQKNLLHWSKISGLRKIITIIYLCELLHGQELFERPVNLGMQRVLLVVVMVVVFTPMVGGLFTGFRAVISTHGTEISSKQLLRVHFL